MEVVNRGHDLDFVVAAGVLVFEGFEDLFKFHSSGDMYSPIWKIPPPHDRKPAPASAAIIIHAVRFHFHELRADLAKYPTLWLHDSHQSHNVTRVV